MSCCTRRGVMSFLSTPSVRRATLADQQKAAIEEFLSTPSVRRATGRKAISSTVKDVFLSTPSVRRATSR